MDQAQIATLLSKYQQELVSANVTLKPSNSVSYTQVGIFNLARRKKKRAEYRITVLNTLVTVLKEKGASVPDDVVEGLFNQQQ